MSRLFDVTPVADGNRLWVRTSDSTVAEIDPATLAATATLPADPAGGGGDVALGYGSLWVANFGADTVWRDRLSA